MILPSAVPFSIGPDGVHTAPSDAKISGTRLAGVLGMSEYDTPFTAACRMLGVYREDIGSEPAVRAGRVLEGVIIRHARDAMGLDVLSAEELFGPQPDDYDGWEPHFDDPDFSGHIDGALEDGTIVEVKTAGDPTKWIKNGETHIPTHYHLQASLYARMMGAEKIVFLLGVVKPKDVSDPYSWEPDNNVFRLDVEPIEGIDGMLGRAREWRRAFVCKGLTPRPTDDRRDCAVLTALAAQTDDGVAESYAMDVDVLQESARDIAKRLDEAKTMLKLRLGYEGKEEMEIGDYIVSVSERTTQRIDGDALRRDGLYEKYTAQSRYSTVKVDTVGNTKKEKKVKNEEEQKREEMKI